MIIMVIALTGCVESNKTLTCVEKEEFDDSLYTFENIYIFDKTGEQLQMVRYIARVRNDDMETRKEYYEYGQMECNELQMEQGVVCAVRSVLDMVEITRTINVSRMTEENRLAVVGISAEDIKSEYEAIDVTCKIR
jgi:hypothetical protein